MFVGYPIDVRVIFHKLSSDARYMFIVCSIEVQCMLDRCSLDLRWAFYRYSIDVRWMAVGVSLGLLQILDRCSLDRPSEFRWACYRYSIDDRCLFVGAAIDVGSMLVGSPLGLLQMRSIDARWMFV